LEKPTLRRLLQELRRLIYTFADDWQASCVPRSMVVIGLIVFLPPFIGRRKGALVPRRGDPGGV